MRLLPSAAVHEVDKLLHGVPGVLALVDRHETVAAITARLDMLDAFAESGRRASSRSTMSPDEIEARGRRR